MKHKTLLAFLTILALVTLSCGLIDDLAGKEGPEATQPPAAPSGEQPTSPPEQPASQEEPPSAGFSWDDIPIYPGASQITEEVALPFPAESTDFELTEIRGYETDDPPEKVADFYLAEMPKKGWEKIVHMPMGESYMSVWQKGNGKLGTTIAIGKREDGKTHIGIIVGREK